MGCVGIFQSGRRPTTEKRKGNQAKLSTYLPSSLVLVETTVGFYPITPPGSFESKATLTLSPHPDKFVDLGDYEI